MQDAPQALHRVFCPVGPFRHSGLPVVPQLSQACGPGRTRGGSPGRRCFFRLAGGCELSLAPPPSAGAWCAGPCSPSIVVVARSEMAELSSKVQGADSIFARQWTLVHGAVLMRRCAQA